MTTTHEKDDSGHCGHDGTETIDGGAVVPAGWSVSPPVEDQSGLGQGESGEHADGEQRDHLVGIPAHGDQQHGGQSGEHPDAVGKDLSIAA
jgi:hypothetical protein